MTEYNGLKSYTTKAQTRGPFYKAKCYESKQVTVKSGQVLKAMTFLETDNDGKAIAHTGINEQALVTFADITNGQTIILGGLTFTAGAGGTTKEDLVTAWAGLAASTGYAAANTANPVSGGSFTAGTLTGYKTVLSSTADSVLFISTTANTGVTDLADSGTATDPTITVTAVSNPPRPIAGVLMYDVDASSADVEATAYSSASFWEDSLVWDVDPATDTVEKSDGTTVACTDYYIGATTDNLKKKFVENSAFAELGFQHAGEVY
jgi:hypothetical protein